MIFDISVVNISVKYICKISGAEMITNEIMVNVTLLMHSRTVPFAHDNARNACIINNKLAYILSKGCKSYVL